MPKEKETKKEGKIPKKEKTEKEKPEEIQPQKEIKAVENNQEEGALQGDLVMEETERFWEATGRRKTSSARIRIWVKGKKEFLVNDKHYKDYFKSPELGQIALSPLETMNLGDRLRVMAKVSGGGLHSQAEAVRHSLSRALLIFNPNFQKRLKKAGFLTRDPRMRERKKFGLKRARRAPQWTKR